MIPKDDVLYGFVQSFDMSFMRSAFEIHMPTLGSITSCRIERFRYRKQNRATFLYELETASGRDWISGSLYAGRKVKRTFDEARENRNVGYIPELGMWLERFPQDRKLSFVSELMRNNSEILVNGLGPCFGSGWKLAITEIVPVRYRPRLAAVLRVEVRGTKGKVAIIRRFFVKTYAEGDVVGMFHDLSQNRDGRTYSLLRPVVVMQSANTIAWPEIPGPSLADALVDGGDRGQFTRVAAALTEFHRSDQVLPKVSPTEVVRRESAKHGKFISTILPSLAFVTDELARILPQAFGEQAIAPCHHDMKPEHVLFQDSHVAMIDVEGIALCDPALDIGNMLARISASCWLSNANPESCGMATAGFLEGIARVDDRKLAAAFALGKMKTATFAISHQINDWVRIATRELEEATYV